MGALIRAFDWSSTSLGPILGWPQSLKTTVDIVLRSPVPLVTLWGRHGIMIYNDAYSIFAGGRHPQLLGSRVLEGWPEVADLNRRVMEVGLRGETLSFRNEHLVLYRPGRPEDVWVDLDYSPLLDESGKPAGVLAVVIETTERVRAEKALRDSEAQFRTFAAAMPNHVWSADVDGRLDWFNQQVFEYTGAGPDDLLGDGWGKVVEPQDLERAVAAWQKALRESSVYEVQFRLRRSRRRLSLASGPRHADPRWSAARSSVGSAPTPTSTTRSAPRRALRDREAELARVQQIGKVGGVEVVPRPAAFATAARPSISRSTACRRKPPQESTRTGCSASIRKIAREPSGSSSTPSGAGCGSTTPNTASCARTTGRCAGSRSRPRSSAMRRAGALRLVGAHIDVTDSKLAEQAVRESEQRFRLVSESAPVMLWMGDVDGKCLYLNRTLRDFWGVAAGGRGRLSIGTRRCTPTTGNALRRRSARPCATTRPSRSRPATAASTASTACCAPMPSPASAVRGEFLGMIGVNVDITETRRAEQALKESEERFRLIANSAPVPMWVSRLDGKRAFVNQAYMDFLGLGYEECLVFDWTRGAASRRSAAHSAGADCGRRLQQAVRAGGALSPRRRPVALAALGVAAALGSGRRTHRLHRRRARHHVRPSRPKSSCAG